MAEQSVTLNPGESRVVSFSATPSEARTYQVSVDGLTGSFAATAPPFSWLRPTGHADPENGWNDEQLAYDGWTDTFTESRSVGAKSWSRPLEFLITPTEVSAIRIWSRWRSSHIAVIEVFYNETWHRIYEDSLPAYQWVEISIPDGTQLISKARFLYYNLSRSISYTFRIGEFEFYGTGAPPPPPEPIPTTNLTGYVTDRNTGAPIVGVTGSVYQDYDSDTLPHEFTTNAEGYYEITGMIDDADQNLMVVYADGYQTYTDEYVPISEGDNVLNIQMTREQ